MAASARARGMELSNWSDELRSLLRRRLCETGGLVLIALAAVIATALATWSVQDPSLSHATDGAVRNLLGTPGAIGADLLMQLFGLASTVLILPVAVWGWRIATHRPFDREWMRLSFWLGGTVFAAGFAACLPKSDHWPLPTGLGGVIGDALLRMPAWVFGAPLSGAPRFIVAMPSSCIIRSALIAPVRPSMLRTGALVAWLNEGSCTDQVASAMAIAAASTISAKPPLSQMRRRSRARNSSDQFESSMPRSMAAISLGPRCL